MLIKKDSQLFSLIKKAQEGDEQAFSDLYTLSYHKVYMQALTILKNTQNAEDVTQDIFIRLLDALPSLQQPEQYNFWLHRITYRFCISFIRKNNKFPDQFDEFNDIPDPADSSNPLNNCVEQERHDLIFKSLSELPFKYRTTLLLKYYAEEPIKSIAIIMNCSEGTVKSRLHTGRELLKNSLKAKGISVSLFGVLPISSAIDTLALSTPKPDMAASLESILSSGGSTIDPDYIIDMTSASMPKKSIGQIINYFLIAGITICLMGGAVYLHTQGADSKDALPTIGPVSLPSGYTQTLKLNIPVQNSASVSQVYLLSDTGKTISTTAANASYEAVITENGHYTIVAESKLYGNITSALDIHHIDRLPPQLYDYLWQNNELVIFLSDNQSGVDFNSIYAETTNDTHLFPSKINPEAGSIVFTMNPSDAEIYFKDTALNQDSLSVTAFQEKVT